MVGRGGGSYSSSYRSSSSNSRSNTPSSSNSSTDYYSASSRESHAPCNIHIEGKFDNNAIQNWIKARNIFSSVADRKILALRAKQHLVYVNWRIRQSNNGKLCYIPPNDKQIFSNLLDACLFQVFNIVGGAGSGDRGNGDAVVGDCGGGGGDAVGDNDVDDVDDDHEVEEEEEEEQFDSLDQLLFKNINIGDELT
jgi:hypothetical protein